MPRKRIVVVGVAWALGLIAPAGAAAATFTVNTTADSSVVGGCTTEPACSLRDALNAAGVSADPEDVVVVPAGAYALSAGGLPMFGAGTVVLRGAGARSTVVNAGGASRVLEVTAEKATIEGLTITGGKAAEAGAESMPGDGGGILVKESDELTLNAVAVVGNVAALNGGGVSSPAEEPGLTSSAIVINASTISGNRVTGGAVEGLGGGVYALGSLAITNSTVTGNSVENTLGTNQGGGVLAGIDPLATTPTTATVLNSTIAGNSVSVGGVGGGLTIYNPTVGVATALSAKNTIVAGNTVGGAPGDCGTVAVITSVNNLSSDASCMFTDPGSKQNANPLLGPLANNGGQTDTMALPAGSPALDAGTNAGCPPTDQRGVTRPQGPACDIGAFELQAGAPTTPTADLKLTLKATPKHPHPGQKVTFKLRLANAGPSTATGIVVKGTAPALAKKIAPKKVKGKRACKLAKPKGGKRKLTCRFASLPARKSRTVKIVVPKAVAGKLRVKARVRSAVADPKAKNGKAKKTRRGAARPGW